MPNIIDYLCCEFDPLSERPLGDVDSLVLSWLSYYRLPADAKEARTMRGAPIAELYRKQRLNEVTAIATEPASSRYLLAALVANPRFEGTRLGNYVEELDEIREKQFSAMTFRLPGGIAYLAFRGTDNTLVGWKEDFNLAFEHELPSQRAAREYLERAASRTRGPLYVGGHSKGGNLALYAAMTCSDKVARRIEAAFSHDGPGFTPEMMSSPTWEARAHLIRKTIPNQSLVGLIFDQQDDYTVVTSTETGIMQHDPFSWEVEGTALKTADRLSFSARHVEKSLNDWLAGLSRAERERFVETLFAILAAGGERTFAGLTENWTETVPAMLDHIGKLPAEQRGAFLSIVGALFRELVPDLSLRGIAASLEEDGLLPR